MTIRVMLGASTPMVGSALRATLGDCEDIELVDNHPSNRAANIHVLVLQQQLMHDFSPALERIPDGSHLGVVAIDDDGAAGNLFRIYRTGWRFVPSGGHGLVDAIRAVAGAG